MGSSSGVESGSTIAVLGEQGLLKLLQSYCPQQMVGDDAALLTPAPGQQLVVTTDVLVEGVHFSDRTTPPHSAGWRAMAANLSDLAAMGATGLGVTVGLSLPPSCPVNWVEQLYQGMTDCLASHGLDIVGGDVCRAERRAMAITALGQVEPGQAWQRSTAQVGDLVLVTGCHGGSRAGLALLLGKSGTWEDAIKALPPTAQAQLMHQHQYPQPRLDWVRALEQAGLRKPSERGVSSRRSRISAMDSSDGLADAVLQICRASRVGARLDATQIPKPVPLHPWPDMALNWALYGGEDFELVLCLNPNLAAEIQGELPLGATIIGEITAETDVVLCQENERVGALSLEQGFQHFASPESESKAGALANSAPAFDSLI